MDTAIIVCPRSDQPEAELLDLHVAGLRLLTRALLTAQHAGFSNLLVVATTNQQTALRQQVEAESRLATRVQWVNGVPESLGSACAVLASWVVLQASALRSWRQTVCGEGITAPAGSEVAGPWLAYPPLVGACIEAARDGQAGLRAFHHEMAERGELRSAPWDGAPPELVGSADEIPGVERRMLRAGRSVEDGPLVDRYVNRTFSERLTRAVVRWPITPNQITLLSLATGLFGAWMLTVESAAATLFGLVLFQSSVILDHTDGEVARLKFQFSQLGKWLDNFSDHIVDLAVIAAAAWRVARTQDPLAVVPLGIAAAVGVTGSFLIVFWWTLTKDSASDGGRGGDLLRAMANRDGFCLAVWATLLPGRPAWLLWTLAIGSNVFWLVWLAVYGIPGRLKVAGPGTERAGMGRPRENDTSRDAIKPPAQQ